MNKWFLKLGLLIFGIVMTGVGASIGLKAAIGVGAWDALSVSVSGVIEMKVGTFSMLMNISCVFLQLLILRKEFKIKHVLQVGVAVLLGYVVNFMMYEVLSTFTVESYWMRMVLLILSCIVCAASVSLIMAINVITFPLESCCIEIAKRLNKKFGTIRQLVDIISIVAALAVSFFLQESITVREGTILLMILFGPLLDVFMNMYRPSFRKVGLME